MDVIINTQSEEMLIETESSKTENVEMLKKYAEKFNEGEK